MRGATQVSEETSKSHLCLYKVQNSYGKRMFCSLSDLPECWSQDLLGSKDLRLTEPAVKTVQASDIARLMKGG